MTKKDFKKRVLCGTCVSLVFLATGAFAKTTAVINPKPERTAVHAEDIVDRRYLENVEAALDIHNFVQSRINPRLLEHDSTKNAKVDNALNKKRSETCDSCNQALLAPYVENADEVWEKMKERMDEAYGLMSTQTEEEGAKLSTDIEDYLGVWDAGREILMVLYKDMDNWEGKLPKRKHYSFKLWPEQEKLYDELEWEPKYTKINQEIAKEIGTSCITVASDRHREGEKKIKYPEFDTTYYSGAHYDYYHHDGEFMTAHNDYLTAIEVEYKEKWQAVYDETYATVLSREQNKTCTRTVSCPGGSCCGSTNAGSGSSSSGSSSSGLPLTASSSTGSSGSNDAEPTTCEETYKCPNPEAEEVAKKEAEAAAEGVCPEEKYKKLLEKTEKMRTEEAYIPIKQPTPLPPIEETVIELNGRLYPEDPVLWTYKNKDYKWSENKKSDAKAGELQNNRLSRYVMVEEEKQMSQELQELHQATDLLTLSEIINMATDYGIDLKGNDGQDIVKIEDGLFLINGKSCGVDNDTDLSKNVEKNKTTITGISCVNEGDCDTLGQKEDKEDEDDSSCNTEKKITFDYDSFSDVRFNTDQFDKMTELNKENLTELKKRFLEAKDKQMQDAEDRIKFFHMDEHTPQEVAEARQTMAALKKDKEAKTLLTYNNPTDPLNYKYAYKDDEKESVYGKNETQKEQKGEYKDAFEQYEKLTENLSGLINEYRIQLEETWKERMKPEDTKCLQEGIDGSFPEGEQALKDLDKEIIRVK